MAVVGAGILGLATARTAVRQGLRGVVVDRDSPDSVIPVAPEGDVSGVRKPQQQRLAEMKQDAADA